MTPVAAAPVAAAPLSVASGFVSVAPVRVLDTRDGGGPVGPDAAVTLDLSARLPQDATAVVLNVTATGPTAGTFVTVFPHGTQRPEASNLNPVAGQTRANLVTVMVGADRAVDLYNAAGTVQLIADLAGYYAPGAALKFTPMQANRVLDTRWTSPGVVGPGGVVTLDLSRWVPASATAVTFNLTATSPTAGTWLTAWPHGAARPNASNLNLVAGETVANLVTVSLESGRQVDIVNQAGNVALLVDFAGFYTADYGALFTPVPPVRILDTRTGIGTSTGQPNPVGPGRNIGVLTGQALPNSAIGAIVNLTATQATASTYVTAWLSDYIYATTSNVNVAPGQNVPNLAVAMLGYDNSTSRFEVYNGSGSVHVIADLAGYFAVPPTSCSSGCGYSWGPDFSSLGRGTTNSSSGIPGPLSGLSGVTAITEHYAVRADGSVWAWGMNGSGQLGNGWFADRNSWAGTGSTVPVRVLGLPAATAVAGAQTTGYALATDGTVWSWGDGGGGQLGDGTSFRETAVPVRVTGLTGVTAIAAGLGTGYALRSDGTVWAWGSNDHGALGNGATVDSSAVPVRVSRLTGIVAIAAGQSTGFAVKSDGSAWSWGRNNEGQLGNGSTVEQSPTPVRVSGLTGVTRIAGDYQHGFAVRNDGTVWSWGDNHWGGLGIGVDCLTWPGGPECRSSTPVQVFGLSGMVAVGGLGAGGYALRSDGTVWAWGINQGNELARPDIRDHATSPVQASGLAGITAIAPDAPRALGP